MPEARAQRDVFGEYLCELTEEFESVLCLDGDLGTSTRADTVAECHPDRFLQMGIAEQNMFGVAAGLAAMGFVPFISTFACFAAKRAIDQVRVSIAQPKLSVKVTGAYSGILTGKTGKTHQSVEDIAVMRAMPNMTVMVPADATELRQMMRAAVLTPGPMYLRLTRDPFQTIFDDGYRFQIGKAAVLREGGDVAIIGTGVQSVRALQAAEDILAREGISAYVLHVPCVKPLDADAIVRAAERTGVVVTVEDHSIIGGLGGAVAEVLSERHPTVVKRMGLNDVFGESAADQDLLEKHGLTPRHVAQAAVDALRSAKH